MQRLSSKPIMIGAGIAAALLLAAILLLFLPFSSKTDRSYVYIDEDDNIDSVYAKIETAVAPRQMLALKVLTVCSGYASRIRPGRYGLQSSDGTLRIFRTLKNGQQSPLQLTIPPVRTMTQLAAKLGKVLKADSASLAAAFTDEALCRKFGLDTNTLACIFLANTYEVYWDISPEKLVSRMDRESRHFWTDERRQAAEDAGLTTQEVVTLASIVDQETANDAEKPQVAGMYLNRLRTGMKLQADPTVKFALKQFGLKRILHEHLAVDSPYNTYKHEGLPPGPICIPSLSSIEAVLNYARHDYIYMCAKEDFSGTHNFAATYEEHLKNARRYADALDAKGIK